MQNVSRKLLVFGFVAALLAATCVVMSVAFAACPALGDWYRSLPKDGQGGMAVVVAFVIASLTASVVQNSGLARYMAAPVPAPVPARSSSR